MFVYNGTMINKSTMADMAKKAGYREKYAMEHGIAKSLVTNGEHYLEFELHPDMEQHEEYVDWIGATYCLERKKWVD